ncbi:unnamed protein product, partial [marine sediment metagenome]
TITTLRAELQAPVIAPVFDIGTSTVTKVMTTPKLAYATIGSQSIISASLLEPALRTDLRTDLRTELRKDLKVGIASLNLQSPTSQTGQKSKLIQETETIQIPVLEPIVTPATIPTQTPITTPTTQTPTTITPLPLLTFR